MMIKSIKVIPTINIKPITTLLVFPMAFLCAIIYDVKAETLTYNICNSGCEYNELDEVFSILYNMSINNEFNGQDIVINIDDSSNQLLNQEYYINYIIEPNRKRPNSKDNINSFTINSAYLIQVQANNMNTSLFDISAKKIKLNNLSFVGNPSLQGNEIDLENITNSSQSDENTIYNVKDSKNISLLSRNVKGDFENTEFGILSCSNCNLKINNSSINLFISDGKYEFNNVSINETFFSSGTMMLNSVTSEVITIYKNKTDLTLKNSDIKKIVNYGAPLNIHLDDNYYEYGGVINNLDNTSELNDYYVYDYSDENSSNPSTHIYYEKNLSIIVNNEIDIYKVFKYLSDKKNVECDIKDQTIAKYNNNKIIGLKEGSTKVTVTTDDGHYYYILNLKVEKETIPEKIDKMTIKVPITGSKIRVWVVIVSVILLAVIGGCIYMLIRRKK